MKKTPKELLGLEVIKALHGKMTPQHFWIPKCFIMGKTGCFFIAQVTKISLENHLPRVESHDQDTGRGTQGYLSKISCKGVVTLPETVYPVVFLRRSLEESS